MGLLPDKPAKLLKLLGRHVDGGQAAVLQMLRQLGAVGPVALPLPLLAGRRDVRRVHHNVVNPLLHKLPMVSETAEAGLVRTVNRGAGKLLLQKSQQLRDAPLHLVASKFPVILPDANPPAILVNVNSAENFLAVKRWGVTFTHG